MNYDVRGLVTVKRAKINHERQQRQRKEIVEAKVDFADEQNR